MTGFFEGNTFVGDGFGVAHGFGDRHDLKAAGIRDNSPIPVHKGTNPTMSFDDIGTGILGKMVGIDEDTGSLGIGNVDGIEGFENRPGGIGEKDRQGEFFAGNCFEKVGFMGIYSDYTGKIPLNLPLTRETLQ